MPNEELKELFENEDFSNVLNFKGSKEMICTLLDENNKKGERISALETKIENLTDKINEEQLKFENHNQQVEKEKNEMNMRIESQEKTIKMCEDFLEKQQKFIETQNMKIKKLENQIKLIQSNSEEELKKQQKIIEEQMKKINEIEPDVLNKTKNEQEKQQKSIDSQGKKIVELERKIDQYIKIIKLEGTINVNVEQDQTIKGIIDIKEKGTKLDKKRSKYILNTNNSSELGSSSYNNGFKIEDLKQEVVLKKSAGTYYLHALLIDNLGNEMELVSQALQTKGVVLSYKFTGSVETVTLDPGAYKLEVWGAEGGKNDKYKDSSGKGGYSVGILTLKEKRKFYIHVGESPSSMNGGWNGGGSGTEFAFDRKAVGGGGSTDIPLYGEEGSSNWNNDDHLYSRIIVAGAGGGSATCSRDDWYGGFGGGLIGQSSGHDKNNEYGGSQTRAGISNSHSEGQGFGVGGSHTGRGSSGGGGGWYGGSAPNELYNAAGGSGYVYNSSTASNYPLGCKLNSSFYLSDSKTESGDQIIPNPNNSSTEKGHSGHGYAKITPL